MKKFQILLLSTCLVALTVLTGCPGDEPDPVPSAGEEQYALLDGQWTISTVTFDGTSRLDTWGNSFTISFSGGAEDATTLIWGGRYSTSGHNTADEPNALDVWPASGNWVFSGENSVQEFSRDGSQAVAISNLSGLEATPRTLRLTFTIPDPSGRTEGVFDAPWVFEFTR
ncbi:MAG: hypothetical protein R8G66_12580 [Cytophagales bacterium]|nr:hypothetical protein [Cytophagales bacterium]